MYRKISIILLFIIVSSFLSGCFDSRELDELAYVMAIGMDIGKTNNLKMTFQIAKPSGGGGEDKGGGSGGKSSMITTIETPSLYSGLNMVNTFVSRQVNLSHAKVIVFSEKLAKKGIEQYLHAFARGMEFRPNMYIAVSKGSAEDFIRSVQPQLESNPAKFYELTFRGYRYTGFTSNSQIHKFYYASESLYIQPSAVLAGVSPFESSKDFELDGSTYNEKGREKPLEGDFKAGEVTKTGEIKAEIMGLAVFNGAKMVGELDGEETTSYLMVSGEYNYAYITLPDPKIKDRYVVLNVRQSRQPKNKVKMVDGKPQIQVKVILEADILSIQSSINYEQPQNTVILETSAENFIKERILSYLNKTAKEYHSDICGFGENMKSKFLTWKEWEDFKWLDRYKDSAFVVDVDLKIRRPGLLVRSVPFVSSGEEGGSQ